MKARASNQEARVLVYYLNTQRKHIIIKRTEAETIKMGILGSSIKTEVYRAGVGNLHFFCKPLYSNRFILKYNGTL